MRLDWGGGSRWGALDRIQSVSCLPFLEPVDRERIRKGLAQNPRCPRGAAHSPLCLGRSCFS